MQTYEQATGLELRVVSDLAALAEDGARLVAQLAKEAVAERGRFTLALSGGSTPRPLYERLAAMGNKLPWDKIHLFWGDERTVPPTSPESNYLMAKVSLIDKVPLPPANVHRILSEEEPKDAAKCYGEELRRFFAVAPHEWPCFDLVLLGLGDDCHTASLFPGTAACHDVIDPVVNNYVGKLDTERITMTFPLLNHARVAVVLASGAGKRQAVKDSLESPPSIDQRPVQGVRPESGRLIWLVDAPAAAGLKDPRSTRDRH